MPTPFLLRIGTALAALLAFAAPAAACPVCDPPTGRAVRMAIFGGEGWSSLALTLAPLPVMALAVWIVRAACPDRGGAGAGERPSVDREAQP